ncbi:MAG: TolC family protein, partial [Bacteroidetes bacterium]|nr:TolC family protein [Bacteroidota bacterium]
RPMPGFRAVYAGVTIPLSFSSFNRGEVREARAFLDQSQIQLSQQRVIVSNEVHAAYDKAKQMQLKRELFSESIVADAERVRDAILYSYQRGEASLLEVLEAQRTLNEVYTNYYDALSDYAESLITLSTASGQWLLEFHSN